jgi:hypothetical protein
MHELWFWLVSVFSVSPAGIRETSMYCMSNVMDSFSVSPAGIRETSTIERSLITMGVCHA